MSDRRLNSPGYLRPGRYLPRSRGQAQKLLHLQEVHTLQSFRHRFKIRGITSRPDNKDRGGESRR